MHPVTLPQPSPDESAHSRRVARHLRAQITAAGGAIGFDRFMELALYAPGLGYYSAGAHKFGAAGDFVTAPEISPLFAHALAGPIGAALDAERSMLEIGAGSGAFAAQLLARLDADDRLPGEYLILERSADLRARQQARVQAEVPALWPRVRWIDELPGAGFRGVMFGNEVLDAIPARRFRRRAGGVDEAQVECRGDGFGWRWAPAADARLDAAVAAVEDDLGEPLADGYVSEVAPARDGFVSSLAERLADGVLLLVDYGYPRREYYHRERVDGTLRCHYRHRAHADPFLYPGLQDLSVHVDFTAVADAAVDAGLALGGYTTQGQFLLASGVLDALSGKDPTSTEYLRLTREIKLLTLPGQMGDLVKVIAFTRGPAGVLAGFGGRDLRSRL